MAQVVCVTFVIDKLTVVVSLPKGLEHGCVVPNVVVTDEGPQVLGGLSPMI
jgi:hypothetical protein